VSVPDPSVNNIKMEKKRETVAVKENTNTVSAVGLVLELTALHRTLWFKAVFLTSLILNVRGQRASFISIVRNKII
jgi:hypothetical protein